MPDDIDLSAGLEPTPRRTPRQPRQPTTYDPDSALDLIAKHESGDRNVPNYRFDPGHTAQGHFQITNTNWRNYGPRAGVDVNKYPSAMAAPRKTQANVAKLMYGERGFQDWAPFNPSLRRAIGRGERAVPQQQSQIDLSAGLEPSGQTPPPTTPNVSTTAAQPATSPTAGQSRQPSVPLQPGLKTLGTSRSIPKGLLLPRGQRNAGPAGMPILPTPPPSGPAPLPLQLPELNRNLSRLPEEMVQAANTPAAAEREQVAQQVTQQRAGRRGAYGQPTVAGVQRAVSQPAESLAALGLTNEESFNREVDQAMEAARQQRRPEVEAQAQVYRQRIRDSGGLQNALSGGKWMREVAAQIASPLEGLAAGAVAATDPAGQSEALRNTLATHAAALAQAAEEEGADRGTASKFAQHFVSGTVASVPEFIAMAKGVPAPVAFGASGALQAAGRGEGVTGATKAFGENAASALPFETPVAESLRGLKRNVAKGLTVGASTTALELAKGQSLGQAAQGGLQNALMAGALERTPASPLERGLERLPPRELAEPDAAIAARLRGTRETPVEPLPQAPEGEALPTATTPEAQQPAPTAAVHHSNFQPRYVRGERAGDFKKGKPQIPETPIRAPEPTATPEELQQANAALDLEQQVGRPAGRAPVTDIGLPPVGEVPPAAPVRAGGQVESKPASDDVLRRSQNTTGTGTHRLAEAALNDPEWRSRVLKEIGEGAEPIQGTSSSRLQFRTRGGEIVTIEDAYGNSKPPTVGDKRDGLVITREAATETTPAPEVAKPEQQSSSTFEGLPEGTDLSGVNAAGFLRPDHAIKLKGAPREHWSGNTYEYEVGAKPTASVVPETEYSEFDTNKTRPRVYNRDTKLMDAEGQPAKGWTKLHEVKELSPDAPRDDKVMYRGMSGAELQSVLKSGEIRSNSSMNLGDQVGRSTSFAVDPASARAYAAGFAPWYMEPTFETPSYVVKVKRPADVKFESPHSDNYLEADKPVPLSDIQEAWEIRLARQKAGNEEVIVDPNTKQARGGSKSPPFSEYVARKIDPSTLKEQVAKTSTEVPVSEQPKSAEVAKPAAVGERVSEGERQPWEMTKKEFDKQGYSLHRDIRSKTAEEREATAKSIAEKGLERRGPSFGNTLPAYRGGEPSNVVDRRYAPRAGDKGYLIPRGRVDTKTGNYKAGYKPATVDFSRDYQSAHEAAVETALKQGKPVPPEVLADYPDLQRQQALTPTPPSPPVDLPPARANEPARITAARERLARQPATDLSQFFKSEKGEFDPQRVIDLLTVHGYDLYQSGKTKFDDWSKSMKDKFGERAEPYLQRAWANVGEREPSETAVKNASMEADRVARDLPELAQAEPRKAQEVHDKAIDLNQRDPRAVDRLTEQALNTDKNFTDVETAQVRLRAQEIKNRESELLKEIDATNDPATIRDKRLELDSLTDEFDRLSQATKRAGTEWGRAGVARQQAIDQDFSLVAMKARLKAAKGDALSSKEDARVEDLQRRIAQAEKERDKALEQAARADLQKQINRVARQQRRTTSRKQLDDEFAQLQTAFAQARAQTKGVQPSGLAGLDPEGTLTKIIGQMARNRIKAGVTDAAQLVDDVHAAVADQLEGVSKRDIRDAISGYGVEPKGNKQSDDARRLAQVRTELRNLSKSEDVVAGAIPNPRDVTRRKQLEKQEASLQQRIAAQDFERPERTTPRYTRETYAKEKQVKQLKAEFEKMRYRATRSPAGKILDTAVGAGNIPKTLLSMADVSAVLRQGGIGYVQHPVLSTRAARDMLTAFTEHGFTNVENAIKSSPEFENAKKSGVEFTGVDRDDPHLNRREEGYLGSSAIDTLARGRFNPIRGVKAVKDFSERTFVSFLDSQRMRIFEQQSQALRNMGLKGKELNDALKSQAKYINRITGRGSLGTTGNKLGPSLNLLMFSPRLVASRFQFLANPATWAFKPKGARKLQMIDDLKYIGGAAAVLGLAKAAGVSINTDPNADDADFLKVKVGNTRFDVLSGLQQPLRFAIRMARAIKGGELYSGEPKSKVAMDFTRSKASPEIGLAWDWLEGKNRLTGKVFEPGKDIGKSLIPLPAQDFYEAIQQDGALRGTIEAVPSLLGVGVQSYKGAAEKPTTEAEKLARRLIIRKMPETARTQEEIDKDAKRSELRARARRGEDVSAEVTKLNLKPAQAKTILEAHNVTRLQEDVHRFGLQDAINVYRVASEEERKQLRPIIQAKAGRLLDKMEEPDKSEARKWLMGFGFSTATQQSRTRHRRSRSSNITVP